MNDIKITIIKSKFDQAPAIFGLRTPINAIMYTFKANLLIYVLLLMKCKIYYLIHAMYPVISKQMYGDLYDTYKCMVSCMIWAYK